MIILETKQNCLALSEGHFYTDNTKKVQGSKTFMSVYITENFK